MVHLNLIKISAEEKHREAATTESLVSSLHLDPTLFAKASAKEDTPMSAMIVFGEHGRELIAAELGVHFVKALCLKEPGLERWARMTRQRTSFVIVTNGNPVGRKRAEEGDFCDKTNEHGVDLARNYNSSWEAAKGVRGFEAWSTGSQSFDQPESKAIGDLLLAVRPQMYVTLHSGRKGIYMPWASTDDGIPKNDRSRMLNVLKGLANYCNCEYGSSAEKVGRFVSGTDLDFAYEKAGALFAFEFEIYAGKGPELFVDGSGPDEVDDGTDDGEDDDQLTFLQRHTGVTKRHAKRHVFKSPAGEAAFLADRKKANGEKCFQKFNPTVKELFDETLSTWSELLLDACELAHLERVRELRSLLQFGNRNQSVH